MGKYRKRTVSKEAAWAALPQVAKSRPELIELNKRASNAGIDAANATGSGS